MAKKTQTVVPQEVIAPTEPTQAPATLPLKTETVPNKGGRPPLIINWEEFDKLCAMQCTLREIAAFFDCSEDTIENKCKKEQHMGFSEYHGLKRTNGKVSLRRRQWQIAMGDVPGEKSTSMCIFLGKQMLGQADKQEVSDKKEFNIDIPRPQYPAKKELPN